MTIKFKSPYRHRSVVPGLPAPSEYSALLDEITANGWYSNFGPLVRRLELGLLGAFGRPTECCVSCSSATTGLSAALLAADVTGAVLVPAFTFAASLGAIRAAGMTPVVVDVDPESWVIDNDLLHQALTETGARAAMLVAPFGIAYDWTKEIATCREHGAAVIIDNAAGLGGPRAPHGNGENIFEVFSMHATKPFAIGEGGAIFASLKSDMPLRAALNFGLASYQNAHGPFWGFNGKMSELHAAVGLAQLARFDRIVRHRQAYVRRYLARLATYSNLRYPLDSKAAPWQLFPILMPTPQIAERFVATAANEGLEIRRYYRPSLSDWPSTRIFSPCRVAEDLAERMCALPIRSAEPDADLVMKIVFEALDVALD
ncbi:DegT/DnrJ/EryC1/StrS family aminotransferase [Mesorhizobium huakuii]|uniref:DegT/DnrJ/EryC1/StrS family aminotransferase n=1 Tax=Mesorhizobium huakuii TaxID=28104 RepID=A0ABZ0VP70_9HYPH|nr:DegT/DnrJ/EryC1/StrS family aminotransferase [Mesorhizobium huakuii]WQB98733.1 DegT/DnrJ/EryC1/StrS family aminotransferase [Mesorhizobium huakuii]